MYKVTLIKFLPFGTGMANTFSPTPTPIIYINKRVIMLLDWTSSGCPSGQSHGGKGQGRGCGSTDSFQ